MQLYQCQAWAKFTGDADYDQPFHCDFSNHTLTAPSEDAAKNSVTILCYFSDVSEAHGPMHYVTRTDSAKVAGPEATSATRAASKRAADRLAAVRALERVACGDRYSLRHRHLSSRHQPDGAAWPSLCSDVVLQEGAATRASGITPGSFITLKPWHSIFEHATPEQLACFGVQQPGDPFWTETTLARAQARYPGWDMTPYRVAVVRS